MWNEMQVNGNYELCFFVGQIWNWDSFSKWIVKRKNLVVLLLLLLFTDILDIIPVLNDAWWKGIQEGTFYCNMKLKQESGCKLFKIYYNFERALCVVVKKKLGKLKKVFKWCGVLHVTCVRFLIIFFFS